jgi:hypothetical protein
LQHGLELVEGGAVDRADRDRRFRIVAIDDEAVTLDAVDDMRRRPHAFIGDGGVKGRQVDRADRLRAEHERVIAHAVTVDLGLHGQRAKAIKARLRAALDAAVEQVHGRQVA